MPRTTGVDILNIKPDAEMGLAQDTSIPVPAVALDQTNKANDDLRLYDHQINLMKYQQKIKDRDRLLEGLEAGQVAVGDIEPEDKKYFDEAEQRAQKAFLAVKEDTDGKRYQEWLAAQQDLKDEANILQLRRAQLQKLRTELAGTISPSEKKAREKHLAEQKAKNPHETITPFQKSLTIDLDKTLSELQTGALISDDGEPVNLPKKTTTIKDANGKITTTTTEKPTDKKPVTKSAATVDTQPAVGADGYLNTEILLEPGKKWSLPEITKKAHQMYLEPSGEGFAQIQGINDIFQGNPDDVPKDYLKKANEKLALFHQQNEIGTIKIPDTRTGPVNPANPDDTVGGLVDTGEYPHQINYRILKDGTIRILDNPADFAAKLALANVAGDYVMKPKKGFSEEAFKLNMLKSKNDSDIMLNGVKAQGEKAKAGWYWAKIADLKDDDKKEKLISDGWVSNLTTQKRLAEVKSDGTLSLAQIPNTETTPMFGWSDEGGTKPVIIKPIGSEVIYGTDPANLATFGKPVGYKGGYYDQIYTRDGFSLTEQDLKKAYDNFVADYNSDAKKSKQDEWTGTIDDFLKDAIKRKKVDVKIKGERGATTKLFHTQAFKKALGSSKNYTDFIE